MRQRPTHSLAPSVPTLAPRAHNQSEGVNIMAATASELRRIYANLFSEGSGERVRELRDALDGINRNIPGSRAEVDRQLRALNAGLDARLTFTQLECLRFVLSEQTFAPLMPTAEQSPMTSAPLIQ